MGVGVILSTYNQPAALEKVLWGYSVQTYAEFEIVVADDGSTSETADLLEAMQRRGLSIRHVWHEDRGFRKCEILNRAVVASRSDYLIFSDGDCIPRRDFVATHIRHSAPGRFLSGGYLKLPREVSARITREEITSGRAFRPGWLRAQGWRPGRRALRLLPPGPAAAVLDALTPTRPTWNGHNASAAREALLRVNGYDMDMGYGGEDRALGERLRNAGLRGVQIRHRAPCLHLHHDRPYVDPAVLRENRRIRETIRREHRIRAMQGIAELSPGPA